MSRFKGSTSARFVKNPPNYNKFGNNQSKTAYNGRRILSGIDSMSKLEAAKKVDEIDCTMGFERYEAGPKKVGWLINFHPTLLTSSEVANGLAACDFYFLDEEGGSFKTTVQYDPYFYLVCRNSSDMEVEDTLKKHLEGVVKKFSRVEKEDLALPNHLVGLKRSLIKLSFHNLTDMLTARRFLVPVIEENQKQKDARDVYAAVNASYTEGRSRDVDALECIDDMKEYDVPYHVRVAIDRNLRVGKWYSVAAGASGVVFSELDVVVPADPVVMAFDIETSKAPLKFPDAAVDQIMMISYMIDGDGYLITNRDIISTDIEDFEYTPRPEYPGNFAVHNAANEAALIKRFFEHICEVRPTVIVTFNGDFFDWPFVETRASFHGISMYDEIGFMKDSEDEYKSSYCAHMDCFRWVKRDSYLPQGSQGLKAVTTVKLGYNPLELDPELMTPYAIERPQVLAEYSVSDAVATYYLYYKYVHPFIFSLATIIPLNPDEVLRKGTGTLCEMLLMVQAYEHGIVLPNKHTEPLERFYNGHLVEAETYVGGHVESLEAGVFRSDLESAFHIDPSAVDELLAGVRHVVEFFVTVESGKLLSEVLNVDQVVGQIQAALRELKKTPDRTELPLIYHVDVASMYPNIMISNRLQPDSMKSEEDCAACDFNRPGKTCDRLLAWAWRGEFYPAKTDEYSMIKRTLQNETFGTRRFDELRYSEQVAQLKKRVSDYSRKVYHRIKTSETVTKEAVVCQRENPFYIDTVRSFRDRRYTYKGLAKKWKRKAASMLDPHAQEEAKKMVITYDSLQLAHKVILNSFYGYVMRKGSRWYSMEMAGITCLTGATIIQTARSVIERFGRPLELDTDGIWCIIPSSFPDEYQLKTTDGSVLSVSYLCSMLNHLVHQKFTNHQYQELVDGAYKVRSENSIFFELDGPYKAMILPTSKEEGRGIKKRYAVFNHDGSLAELKGFELKRRGELQIVKNMQNDMFPAFLEGNSLENCYDTVASVANKWLDILFSKGKNIQDEDLINLIGERKSMSKSIAQYNGMKSTSITTVRRLVEFLGIDASGDKGITAQFVISNKPRGAPIAERAIPIAIFSADLVQKRIYLRKWLKDNTLDNFDPRNIIDWDYYLERLASVVLKIISIPAYLQIQKNPCEKVQLPPWILKKMAENKVAQSKLTSFFAKTDKLVIKDMEDLADNHSKTSKPPTTKFSLVKRKLKSLKHTDLLSTVCPDPSVDYVGWLKYNKQVWRQNDEKKLTNKQIFGNYSSATAVKMLQNQTRNYINSTNWQVISYSSGLDPGQVKAKVLINGKIQEIKIKISKTVFLTFPDCLTDNDIKTKSTKQSTIRIEPTNAIIPRNTLPVYKATMDEIVYNENVHKPGSILQAANVYESQITAEQRAIMELGSCVQFTSKELGGLYKGLQHGFDSAHISTVEHTSYLKSFNGVDIVYLSHVISNQYEIYTLFRSWDSMVSIYILKPSEKALDFPSKFENIYSSLYQSNKSGISKHSRLVNYQEDIVVDLQYFTSLAALNKRLNSRLAATYEEKGNTSILALQSPFSERLVKTIKSVLDFPVVTLSYRDMSLPALKWQDELVKTVFIFYFSLGAWMNDLLELARYSNIPICNLQLHNIGYLIDVEYARRLKKANTVLWWSCNTNPDMGGRENQKLVPISESLAFPNINNPDCYENVVLEISVQNLTINTVLTSALINEAEGSDLADAELSGGTALLAEFSADTFSSHCLAVLRAMVKDWWDDAVALSDYADLMVNNFVQWMQRKGSYLYDPSLQYHVHNLTKKALLQVINEFKKMGSSVVFSNRNKILLKTSKATIENSYAYSQYILKAVRAKPLFNYLDLQIVRYWNILVWMDEYNHAGMACSSVTEAEQQDLVSYSNWQMAKFLPPIYQTEFLDWVALFVDALITEKNHSLQNSSTQLLIDNADTPDKSINDKVDIPSNLAAVWNPLKKRIKKLYAKQNSVILTAAYSEEYMFPKLPGSWLKFGNPTLELVKSLCAVFALSKQRNLESRVLRRELLKYLDVREFSDESVFRNPSVSLKIPEIACENCGLIRDIDVCRDDEETIWNCSQCRLAFNKVALEETLIMEFEKLVALFVIQDLKCEKCGKIKTRELALFCSCSGNYIGAINKTSVYRKLQIFDKIAEFYDLRLLKDTIDAI